MLDIRTEQMAAFRAQLLKQFENRMVKHIGQAYPDQFEAMLDPESGDAPVRTLVRKGVEKAAGYGIDIEADVARFIDLMVEIDPDLDQLRDRVKKLARVAGLPTEGV